MFLKDIKVSAKIVTTLTILSGTILGIGITGIDGMQHSGDVIGKIYQNQLVPVSELAEVNDLISEAFIQLAVSSQHDTRLEESRNHTHPVTFHTDQAENKLKQVDEIWRQYTSQPLIDKEKIPAEKFEAAQKKLFPLVKKSVELLKSGEYQQANIYFVKGLIPAFNELSKLADELRETKIALSKNEVDEVFRKYLVARNLSGAAIGFGLLLAITMSWWLVRTIVRPLREAVAISDRIAQGDLTAEIRVTSKDETGQLMQAMQHMANQLKGMATQITQSTAQVSTAAAEIAQGSADLAQRTEEQASALEETASSMEELTGTVKQSAENAGQANQLAVAARSQAEQGGQVVDRAVTAMSAINQSSRKIADIIGVIDEIAFQTNLLALNAAVEAARAGEQGRGFAVVAGEVRKLAQRSADAAKEIKSLITDSVSKVEDGGKLVEQSGHTLKEIVVSIKKVSDIVAEMTAAAREQATGIEQVNKAILQMDQMTQQNAALVEQTAAASQSMGGQAQELQRLMGFFKLDEHEATAKAVVTTPNPGAASQRNASRGVQGAARRVIATGKPIPIKPQPTARPAPVAKKAASGGAASEEWEEF